ncbi:MAG: pyridoxal-phosphate dependent enzyme, partial [Deltaproteobacteria bacterium]
MATDTIEKEPPSAEQILAARRRIEPHVHRTPVVTCRAIDAACGCSVFFKPENLQKVGAFKARGATNAVLSLSDEQARHGVATHSSGNHAAALAWAAGLRGIDAHIVMPENAPEVKIKAVEGYGARITFCKPTLEAREETLEKVVERTGAAFIHPYDEPLVIAGQATAALELIEDAGPVDFLVAPVGGGGLMSGTCLAAAMASPQTKLVGAEPAGADDAYRSLQQGRLVPSVAPKTMADGLLTSLSPLTFSILSKHLERIVTVSEEAIARALRLILERA